MSERSAEGPAIEVVRPNGDDALVVGGVYLRCGALATRASSTP